MKPGIASHRRVRCVDCANRNVENPYFVVPPKQRGKVRCPKCRSLCHIAR